MGAMHLLFPQVIQRNDIVLTVEYIFGGTICCVSCKICLSLGHCTKIALNFYNKARL